MRNIIIISLIIFIFVSCKRDSEPPLGTLFISTEYDGMGEENVQCWLYESYDKFLSYEYLEKQFSDEYGEVFFEGLEAGWYYVEAKKVKSSLFTIWAADSVEIRSGRQTNKILVMTPVE